MASDSVDNRTACWGFGCLVQTPAGLVLLIFLALALIYSAMNTFWAGPIMFFESPCRACQYFQRAER